MCPSSSSEEFISSLPVIIYAAIISIFLYCIASSAYTYVGGNEKEMSYS